MCDKTISCGGSWKVCDSSTDTAYCDNGQLKCCSSATPYYWNGQCQACPQDKPKKCGSTCYGGNECGSNVPICDKNNHVACCPSDFPSYCAKTDGCWKNSGECDNAQKCGNENWSVCRDPAFQGWNCKPDGHSICCPTDKPYYVNGQCQQCPSDKPKQCGSTCYGGNECGSNVPICDKNNHVACCPSDFPSYCAKTDGCWKNSDQCSKAQNCGSEGWTVCGDANYPNWNCRSDGVSRCCPDAYPYLWNSDSLCHTTQEPQRCTVPDGSSAMCKCTTNSECSNADSSRPYCSKSYPSPISDGYGRCMSSVPEYCGNGNCGSGENYNSCPSDCTQNAPKGTINVNVYYSSGANVNKPISGTSVSLDGVPMGSTDGSGKVSFQASYGSRNVKVNCPDSSACDSRTVNVDGTEYVSFGCSCSPAGDSDGDGYSDQDERLLGTDPNDATSNFGVLAGSGFGPEECLEKLASILIDWKGKSKDDLIQSHRAVVNALNVSVVTAISIAESSQVIQVKLASAGLGGGIISGTGANVTFEKALKNADYVDGIVMSNGLLIIATDYETGTTSLISASGRCLGLLVGLLYGAGNGVLDDLQALFIGLPELVVKIVEGLGKAVWFVSVNIVTGNLKKIEGGITGGTAGLIGDVTGIFKNGDPLIASMVRGILEKGKGVNIFREGRAYNKGAYLEFQAGFFNGFITGYILEQIGTFLVGIGEIKTAVTAIKSGKVAKVVGKVLELPETLAKLAGEFGDKAVEGITKLKYIDNIAKWTESEQKGLARLMKLNEDWAKGLAEAEAKVASQRAGHLVDSKLLGETSEVADEKIKNLLDTNIGRKSLLDEINVAPKTLVKQSKFIDKWGASSLEDVAKRYDGFWPWQKNGWTKANEFFNNVPTRFVENSNKEKTIELLGDSKFMEAVKNIEHVDDTFSSAYKSLNEIDNAVSNGLTSQGVKNVYRNSIEGASIQTRSQNAASFANFEKESNAVFKKNELDIEAVVGKSKPKGADYVAEINGVDTGISVKTPKGLQAYQDYKIRNAIRDSATELEQARKATNMWADSVLNIQVKADDYENAVKFAKQFFDDTNEIKKLTDAGLDLNKFKVKITIVEDYLV